MGSAVYGTPALIVSDRGSQLQAAAGSPNWLELQHRTAKTGSAWRFVPPATPWRVGLAERMVQTVKATLSRQLGMGETLDILQTQALLHRVASILNQRPLTARSFGVEDFMAVTPRDLLLGTAPSLSLKSYLLREGVADPPE